VRSLALASALLTALGVGACNLHNEGLTPPDVALSYPISLALSREETDPSGGDGPDFLYVANTNYDLRYNAGSVQSFDLKKLEAALGRNRCRTLGTVLGQPDASVEVADNTIYELGSSLDASLDAGVSDAAVSDAGLAEAGVDAGPIVGMDAGPIVLPASSQKVTLRGVLCDQRDPLGDGRTSDGSGATPPDCCLGSESELLDVQASHYRIDSYASAIAVSPDNKRLYVPVASRNRLLYFDLNEQGQLGCGDQGDRCRRGPGLNSDDDVPNDKFPGQPSYMSVGRLADLGVDTSPSEGITPDTQYVATGHELGGFGLFVEKNGAPLLEDVLRGLPIRPTSVTTDPRHKLLYVTANLQPFFSRVGLRVATASSFDGKESGPRELLYQTSRVIVSGSSVSQPADLRDITIDPNDDNRLYALIRGSQESVVFLELDPTAPSANARVVDQVQVGGGPSKLTLLQQDGKTFLLASCYDGKNIFVIDTESHRVVAVVGNLSGPFEMVHDAYRRLLYVTDFRVSVLRVIDLAGLTQRWQPPPRIVATIGDPEFEGGLN
jgi:DNA-binding beta-propeller fold protein YncE